MTSTSKNNKRDSYNSAFQKKPRNSKLADRAVSSDFSKSIQKRSFSPIKEKLPTKKSSLQVKAENLNTPVDLLSLFLREPSILKEQLEKTLSQLGVKFIVPSTSAAVVYKCEKVEIKFDLHLNHHSQMGIHIQSFKKQGNNYSFREIMSSILKRLNELSIC